MYRTVLILFTIVLFCFSGPLVACSCGGTLSYAPIVVSPPGTILEKNAENTKMKEMVTLEKPIIPAIPKSKYPDSFVAEPTKTENRKSPSALMHLTIYDLPVLKTVEQPKEPLESTNIIQTTASKPSVILHDEEEGEGEGEEEKSEKEAGLPETYPSVMKIDENEELKEANHMLGQVSSRSGEDALKSKPDQPEGTSRASIPDELIQDPSGLAEGTTSDTTEPDRFHQEPERGSVLLTDHSENGDKVTGQGVPGTQWTITALVMLAALSTFSFLCTVFVVGEYRRRWLNAIMSQNGMISSFQGGLYDVPSFSIGYKRYED